MAQEDTVQVGVRLPRALHQRLVELAQDQRRSLNSQLIWMIEQQLPADDPEDTPATVRRRPLKER